jgi:hypothetical protein
MCPLTHTPWHPARRDRNKPRTSRRSHTTSYSDSTPNCPRELDSRVSSNEAGGCAPLGWSQDAISTVPSGGRRVGWASGTDRSHESKVTARDPESLFRAEALAFRNRPPASAVEPLSLSAARLQWSLWAVVGAVGVGLAMAGSHRVDQRVSGPALVLLRTCVEASSLSSARSRRRSLRQRAIDCLVSGDRVSAGQLPVRDSVGRRTPFRARRVRDRERPFSTRARRAPSADGGHGP